MAEVGSAQSVLHSGLPTGFISSHAGAPGLRLSSRHPNIQLEAGQRANDGDKQVLSAYDSTIEGAKAIHDVIKKKGCIWGFVPLKEF